MHENDCKELDLECLQENCWYDELDNVQSNLIDAIVSIRTASKVGGNSCGDYVTTITDELIDVEDTICKLLGECVKKKKEIISKQKENKNE